MKILLTAFTILLCSSSEAQFSKDYFSSQVEIVFKDHRGVIMHGDRLTDENWVNLPQAQFWKQIMQLSPDSIVINVAATRQILRKFSIKEWGSFSNEEKEEIRKNLRENYLLDSNETIYATTGKNDFYKFDAVIPSISEGIEAFEANQVDPWYAQAILLIESPGQLKKSKTGAYGPFQLMPGVARSQGLTVNKYTDERSDFQRSAYGASNLMKRICIPEAKKILEAHNIEYNEDDLWFRLFVMHVYHAGAGNVKAVLNKINPTEGGQELIQAMWQNKAAGFGNNSQNYTQLALASQLILHEKVCTESEQMYYCKFP